MKKLLVDHCQIADNINNMEAVYHKMGDYKSAKEQFQNAVACIRSYSINTQALPLVTTI